ncbi:hypothetical protein Gotri_002602 [Gossypium trilobum]|uniref:Uncharacterized protein n=1 Tax=Gossypium trilobum TaxID=34281 RepID=A0A7J9F946_9ROSI|nr:hypothetical protein [Gossypium trilobum]
MTVRYRYHRWERFWTIPNYNVVVPVVQEFYASLWDQLFRNTEDHMWDIYTELQTKQIKDWNKRQQEVIATPASSQRVHEREEKGEDEEDDRSEEMNLEEKE